jgi:hypothetical protein
MARRWMLTTIYAGPQIATGGKLSGRGSARERPHFGKAPRLLKLSNPTPPTTSASSPKKTQRQRPLRRSPTRKLAIKHKYGRPQEQDHPYPQSLLIPSDF